LLRIHHPGQDHDERVLLRLIQTGQDLRDVFGASVAVDQYGQQAGLREHVLCQVATLSRVQRAHAATFSPATSAPACWARSDSKNPMARRIVSYATPNSRATSRTPAPCRSRSSMYSWSSRQRLNAVSECLDKPRRSLSVNPPHTPVYW